MSPHVPCTHRRGERADSPRLVELFFQERDERLPERRRTGGEYTRVPAEHAGRSREHLEVVLVEEVSVAEIDLLAQEVVVVPGEQREVLGVACCAAISPGQQLEHAQACQRRYLDRSYAIDLDEEGMRVRFSESERYDHPRVLGRQRDLARRLLDPAERDKIH